jgi:hypothetical protein
MPLSALLAIGSVTPQNFSIRYIMLTTAAIAIAICASLAFFSVVTFALLRLVGYRFGR